MKQLFTLIFLTLFVTAHAQEKRALLIGIGDYPTELGWNKIHGHNDIGIIKNTLIQQGFPVENIRALINAEASYDNIVKHMQQLLHSAKQGDIIYIHFSGHGQRITDCDEDETDGLDEAWIPYDAHRLYLKDVYEGEKHITDDYLNEYLTQLRQAIGGNGKIVVIADACHSGSGSRGDNDAYKRGSRDIFEIPNPVVTSVRKTNPVEWLFVAACKSYQTNYEYKDEHGHYYGSLSYSISKSSHQLLNIKYEDAIKIWTNTLRDISTYPQDLDNEGKPSTKHSNLF